MQVTVTCKFYGGRALYHTFEGDHDDIVNCYKRVRKQGIPAAEALRKARFIAKQNAVYAAYKEYWY